MLLALYACGEGDAVQQSETSATSNMSTTLSGGNSGSEATTDEFDSVVVTTTDEGASQTTTISTTVFSTATVPNMHAPVALSVFDDAVFVGDSLTNNLKLYLGRHSGALGKAKLVCAASLSYSNALWSLDRKGNVHPSYQGQKMRVPDAVAKTGANKVFIMLGMNDFMIYGADKTVQNATTLINQILAKSPNAKIYVQSVTPILAINETELKSNKSVRELNTKLRRMCEKNGWIYLDVASVLVDSNGALDSSYCIDPGANGMGIHINDYACSQWIEYLRCNINQTPSGGGSTTTTTATTTTTVPTTSPTTVTTTATTTAPTTVTTTVPTTTATTTVTTEETTTTTIATATTTVEEESNSES